MRSLTELAPQPFPDTNLPPAKIGTGDVIISATGRSLTPVPRIDMTTDRKSKASLKRLDEWLCEEARQEASFRHDSFNGPMFCALNPEKLSQADRDCVNLYLFANADGATEDQVLTRG